MSLLYLILGGAVLIVIIIGVVIWMRKRKHGCHDNSTSKRDERITDRGQKEQKQGSHPCRAQKGNGDYLTVNKRDDRITEHGQTEQEHGPHPC